MKFKNKKEKQDGYESKPEGPQLADSVHQAWYLPKDHDPSSASRNGIVSFPPSNLKNQIKPNSERTMKNQRKMPVFECYDI